MLLLLLLVVFARLVDVVVVGKTEERPPEEDMMCIGNYYYYFAILLRALFLSLSVVCVLCVLRVEKRTRGAVKKTEEKGLHRVKNRHFF